MNIKEKIVISLLIENTLNSTSTSTENSSTSETDWNNSLSISDDTSSSSEEDDLLLFPLIKYLISGLKRHRIENYLHIVDSWTDLEFKEHLRIERITAIRLIGNTYYKI